MTGTIDASAAAEITGSTRASSGDGRADRQISQVPYLPGLDGIRAIAVVAVMVYHANSNWLAGGYLGVDVFFVISGYLITLLLIAEHERTGRIDLKGFWFRRARRLLPAVFLMMMLLSVWVALFERDALGKLRGDVIAGASYFSNWYQIWIGAGYSAGSDFAPLRHLWSLAVEEQFYLVWPLVMMGFVKYGSRRIAGIARWLFLGAVAITVIVAFLDYTGAQQTPEFTPDAYWMIGDRAISKPDALYLSTFSRSSGLMLGAAFAMVWRPAAIMRGPLRTKGPLFDVGAGLGFGALGVMAVLVSFQPDRGVHGFLFKGGLFFTGIATLAVIAAVTHRGAFIGKLLSIPVLLWIGTRSYGLYLYHWPIYQIIRNIAANKLQLHEFVLAMVATAIITELSYRYVETPIRQGRLSELWRRRRNVGGGRFSGIARRPAISDGQRKGAIAGAFVGTALFVYAGASMATAELQQNDVEQSLDEADDFVCDALTGCDDDAGGDPLDGGQPAIDGSGSGGDGSSADADADADAGDPAAVGVETEPGASVVAEQPVVESTTTSTTSTTTTTLPPAAERLAIGDSVMKGAAPELSELGFAVDAAESRSWDDGLELVRALAEIDRLPETLVIHLGTNSRIGQDGMDAMMAAVSDIPRVLLVTNELPTFPDVEADNNAVIFQAQSTYDNVSYLDWGGGLTEACPGDCFASDAIHLKPDGRQYYAALISDVLGL